MNLQEARSIIQDIAMNKEISTVEKHTRTAGVITSYVKEKINVTLIVVGGLSVEMYTQGNYMTNDIDFVGPDHQAIMDCLADLGYISMEEAGINMLGGNVMRFHPKLESLVEIPDSKLKNADEDRIICIQTSDGLSINVIGLEDIIADRIRATIHYKIGIHKQHIADMLMNNSVDIPYLQSTLYGEEVDLLDAYLEEIVNPFSPKSQLAQLRRKLSLSDSTLRRIYSDFDDLILFMIKPDTYIGMTTNPYLMVYVYNEDEDAMEPLYDISEKSEMTMDEMIAWFLEPINTNEIDFTSFTKMLKSVLNAAE